MILTGSSFLDTTSFLASLRDAERDLVWRGSNTNPEAVSEGLERFDPRAAGCELFSLFTPPFFVVAFLSPASFLVAALDDVRAAGLDGSASSFGLAIELRPRVCRLGLVDAAVLVDVVDFFFFDFVSFGMVPSSFNSSPVTLATSPFIIKKSELELWSVRFIISGKELMKQEDEINWLELNE